MMLVKYCSIKSHYFKNLVQQVIINYYLQLMKHILCGQVAQYKPEEEAENKSPLCFCREPLPYRLWSHPGEL